MKTILGRFVQNRFSPFLLLRPLSLKIKPTSSAYQRPNLNKLLFSEADFQNNIVTRKQPLPIKDGNFHLNDLMKMTDGFDPDDPTNDFFEEVHLGRRCLLCCANVMLTYDSSTGGWFLYHSVALQKISNLFTLELNSVRFHGPDWTNYPKKATTDTKEHTNYINSEI